MKRDPVSYVQQLTRAWNSHQIKEVLPYYAEEYEGMDVGSPKPQHGTTGLTDMLTTYWKAFPDLQFSLQNTIAEDDRIALTWTAEGTHQGPILNIPPTGHKVQINGVSILHIREGQVVRAQYIWDLAGMLRSLGLLPQL